MFKLCGQSFCFDVNGVVWRIYFNRTTTGDWNVSADNGNMEKYELGCFNRTANTVKFCNTMLQLLVEGEFRKS